MWSNDNMTTETKQSKREILVPEVEVRISESWINFIQWSKNNIPNGQICFTIANGEPVKLITKYTETNIRFDKRPAKSTFQAFT